MTIFSSRVDGLRAVSDRFERHRRILQRCAVTGATVLAIVLLAPRVAQGNRMPTLVILGVAGLGAVLFLLRFPTVGLAGILVGGLLIPFSIGTGSESAIHLGMALIILMTGLWLIELMRSRPLGLVRSRAVLASLALAAAAVAALLIGGQPLLNGAETAPIRAQVGGLMMFVLSVAAFLVVVHQVPDLRSLERLTWVFLGLGVIFVAKWTLAGRVLPARWLEAIFPIGSGGSALWVWLVALSASQALFNSRLHASWRAALGALCVAVLAVGVLLQRDWLSGWIPSLLALLAVVVIGRPRWGFAVVGVAVVLAALRFSDVIGLVMGGDNPYSLLSRGAAWGILLKIVEVNPLFGVGPSNYYWYTPIFPILGYQVNFNSHNNYIDIIAQTGLIGLVCFAWFATEIGMLGWRLRSKAPEGFARAYVVGALGALGGVLFAGMLGDWVLPFVYNVGFNGFRSSVLTWLFLGGLVALERMTAEGWMQDATALDR